VLRAYPRARLTLDAARAQSMIVATVDDQPVALVMPMHLAESAVPYGVLDQHGLSRTMRAVAAVDPYPMPAEGACSDMR
jgi:hypothetical protein